MIPQGKFMFLWQLRNVEGGNPIKIADTAVALGLAGVSIKVAQGRGKYNLRWDGKRWIDDILRPAVNALHQVGLRVHGWQWVDGDDPTGEALCILDRIQQMGLDGLEVDAEGTYKGKPKSARIYMSILKDNVPSGFHIGLTSYRYPTLHPEFPWQAFCQYADYHMPQIYWNPPYPPNYGPAPELNRSVMELRAVKDLPIIPAGRTYIGDGHPDPTPAEMNEFMQRCKDLELPGFSFWAYDFLYLHANGKARSDAIAAFQWGVISPPPPVPLTLEERVRDLEIRVTNLGG